MMADHVPPKTPDPLTVNVGLRMCETARTNPDGMAIAMPRGRDASGKRQYQTLTFHQLDDDSNLLADGLASMGVRPGTRLVLMVPPSIDFISLVFAMFKAGVISVLIDPGMGRRNLIRCLAESEPEGFIGIPLAQAVRMVLRRRFPKAVHNVTVGRRWFWGGRTIAQLRARKLSDGFRPAQTKSDDPAAIIFTTGSTGPPKGVLYRHGNFNRQADEIRDFYQIQPGEIDLPGFPLFALFNCAMGVSTVLPDMDPTRPAKVDPRNIIEAVRDWNVTQAFGSPALWNVVGRYCEANQIVLPTLKRVLSAGAPVPPHVLKRMKGAIPPDGDVHTPYGATEALPVASIAASEVLAETAARSATGAGTCVGRHFPGIEWRVIRISDGPIATIGDAEILAPSEIGELIVRGPVVTSEYVTRTDCNPLHKIADGKTFWHRMGDVGWMEDVGQASRLPESSGEWLGSSAASPQQPGLNIVQPQPPQPNERFWFCGRKSHRVITAAGTLFTIPCEAIFNQHPYFYRSALVGVGPPGQQRPVIIAEPWPEHRPKTRAKHDELLAALAALAQQHSHTAPIHDFFLLDALPVDIRHNAKIFREQLAVWAAKKLGVAASP
jgi:acyl-CoA synthetase (AMP-forming)/AMP-acid ligase II